MNREDVLRLAREVDAEISAYIDYHYDQEMVVFTKGQLESFVALVSAAAIKEHEETHRHIQYHDHEGKQRIHIDPVTGNVGIGTPEGNK